MPNSAFDRAAIPLKEATREPLMIRVFAFSIASLAADSLDILIEYLINGWYWCGGGCTPSGISGSLSALCTITMTETIGSR